MDWVMYVLVAIGAVAVMFGAVDFWVAFQQWQSRIHIGRWHDMTQWTNAINVVCWRWLKRTPVVVQRRNRLLLWDILRRQHRNATIQYWNKAGLLLGETAPLFTACNEQKQSCKATSQTIGGGETNVPVRLVQEHINLTTGAWRYELKNIDVALLAYALLQQDINLERVRPAMEQVYQLLLRAKGDGDTLPYRGVGGNIRFVDTIGLVCPFLVKYAQCYSVDEAQQLALRQLREYDKALHPQFGLPPHAYNLQSQTPLGLYDWGRGTGWYILGLVEMYRQLGGGIDEDLADRIIQLSNHLLPFQHSTGGFSSQLFSAGLPPESSATVMAGLLFHEAYRITGEIRYSEAVLKILKCLMQMTQRGGELDLCQGDTIGIGNYSSYYGYMPFAQGMLLLLIKRHCHENA